MHKILIVDDDIYIGDMLAEVVTKNGYKALRAYSGTEAKLLLEKQRPDLILLDLMLPGLSGEQLLSAIKDIPVIVVSAKADIENKVELLLGGAADYITKPFDTKELLARIAVQLRRAPSYLDIDNIEYGAVRLNLATHAVVVKGQEIRLTRTELAILKLLIINSGNVVTKSQMLDLLAEDTPDGTESSLKIHISNLRKKLRCVGEDDYIESVWGIGFKLKNLN